MGREAWRAAVHGVTKNQTQLSDWAELTEINKAQSPSGFLLLWLGFLSRLKDQARQILCPHVQWFTLPWSSFTIQAWAPSTAFSAHARRTALTLKGGHAPSRQSFPWLPLRLTKSPNSSMRVSPSRWNSLYLCSFKWKREKSYLLQTSGIPHCTRRGTQSDPGPPSPSDYETDALPTALWRQIPSPVPSSLFPLLQSALPDGAGRGPTLGLLHRSFLLPGQPSPQEPAKPPPKGHLLSDSPHQLFETTTLPFHPPSHTWNMLFCFICSISFITTYFIVCLSFPIRL